MTDKPSLTPQEPGEIATVEVSKIDAIAAGGVGDLAEALDGLSGDELEQLHAAETKGRGRTTALGAILREQQRRAEDGAPPEQIEGHSDANLGDAETYARMRAKNVDPRKLTGRVLTLDGWVLPLPAAQPVATP